MTGSPPRQRVDKWLWHARFFKTRSLAAALCREGRVRLNGDRVEKSSVLVGAGDTLTFPQGSRIRVVRIAAIAEGREPASAAALLYLDLSA